MPLPNNPNIVNDQAAEWLAEQVEAATPTPQAADGGVAPSEQAIALINALNATTLINPFANTPENEPTQPAPDLPP